MRQSPRLEAYSRCSNYGEGVANQVRRDDGRWTVSNQKRQSVRMISTRWMKAAGLMIRELAPRAYARLMSSGSVVIGEQQHWALRTRTHVHLCIDPHPRILTPCRRRWASRIKTRLSRIWTAVSISAAFVRSVSFVVLFSVISAVLMCAAVSVAF